MRKKLTEPESSEHTHSIRQNPKIVFAYDVSNLANGQLAKWPAM